MITVNAPNCITLPDYDDYDFNVATSLGGNGYLGDHTKDNLYRNVIRVEATEGKIYLRSDIIHYLRKLNLQLTTLNIQIVLM